MWQRANNTEPTEDQDPDYQPGDLIEAVLIYITGADEDEEDG